MPLAIQGIDEEVLLWIQEAVRQAWLDPVVKAFTTLGNAGILWIVLSVAMLFWRPTRKAGLLAGCALIFSLLFTNLGLKLIKKRAQMERTGRREMTDAEDRRHYLFSSMHA
mgnify:CR=1 FL=1